MMREKGGKEKGGHYFAHKYWPQYNPGFMKTQWNHWRPGKGGKGNQGFKGKGKGESGKAMSQMTFPPLGAVTPQNAEDTQWNEPEWRNDSSMWLGVYQITKANVDMKNGEATGYEVGKGTQEDFKTTQKSRKNGRSRRRG